MREREGERERGREGRSKRGVLLILIRRKV